MNNSHFDPSCVVESLEQLRSLYGSPSSRSLIKELDHVSPHYEAFIKAAPFVVMASVGPEGLDTSPRGDAPGFVRVVNPTTLMLPDRRGNNRTDTLINIVRDPRVSLIFLIPGVGETIRVIGQAKIVTDKKLCASFAVRDKTPLSVIVISIDRVYFQCQKAMARSCLWDADAQVDRSLLPTAGEIIQALDKEFDGTSYDESYAKYMAQTLY